MPNHILNFTLGRKVENNDFVHIFADPTKVKIPSEINWPLHISKKYLVKTQQHKNENDLLEFCSTHYDSTSQRCLLGFATYISERDQFFNLKVKKLSIVICYIFLRIQKKTGKNSKFIFFSGQLFHAKVWWSDKHTISPHIYRLTQYATTKKKVW